MTEEVNAQPVPSPGRRGRGPGSASVAERLEGLLDRIEILGTGTAEECAEWSAPTGFGRLDALLGGLQPGLVHAIVGATGVGSSTLALDFARSAGLRWHLPTLYLSGQSPADEIMYRVLAAESRTPLWELRSTNLSEEHWSNLAKGMANLANEDALVVDDRPYRDFAGIDRLLRQGHRGSPWRLVVLDGTRLLSRPAAGENPWAAKVRLSADVKRAALQYGFAAVLTGLPNPRADLRLGMPPSLAEFASASCLAADADVVLHLSRDDRPDRPPAHADRAVITVLKSRGTPAATIAVAFEGHYSRFVDVPPSPRTTRAADPDEA